MTWKIGNQQAPAWQERSKLGEVPRRPAEAVDEQQRRPLTAHEDPQPYAPELVAALGKAGQEVDGIRHADRLLFPAMSSIATRRGA